MLKDLKNVVMKELKEILRDPHMFIGIIIVPIVMFPALGLVMMASFEVAAPSAEVRVGLLDMDRGNVSKIFVGFLKATPNVTVVDMNEIGISSMEGALEYAQKHKILSFIVVPPGFSHNVSAGYPVTIQIYTIVGERVNRFEVSRAYSVAVTLARRAYEQTLSYLLAGSSEEPPANISEALEPIEMDSRSVVRGRILNLPPSVIIGFYFSQVFTIPFILMVLLILAIQIAAVSIASEKEQKTLETLLSLPVDRKIILLGKLTGAMIVALTGALGYMIGFWFYMSTVTSKLAEEVPIVSPEELGFSISPLGYVILGVTLFLTILTLLSMAIMVAAPAEDIRGAQSIVGILVIPLVVCSIFMAFASFALSEELKMILILVPFITPTIVTIELFSGNYLIPLVAIVVLVLEALFFLYLAARLFASEKLITMKISFKRRKGVVEE